MEQSVIQRRETDTRDFGKMVSDCQDMVYNTALSIVQNAEDAEDITQEVFVQLHLSLETFRHESKVSTWLYRVTINKALDHERKKKSRKRNGILKSLFNSDWKEPAHFDHPGVQAENKELAAVLFKAIKKLPEAQKVTYILHKLEGRNHNEIAEITDTTVMAVESLIARAKKNLRKILNDWYESNLKD